MENNNIVTAYHLTEEFLNNKHLWPLFLIEASKKLPWEPNAFFPIDNRTYVIKTGKESSNVVLDGDWIITDNKGNIAKANNTVFLKLFQKTSNDNEYEYIGEWQ